MLEVRIIFYNKNGDILLIAPFSENPSVPADAWCFTITGFNTD